MTPVRFIIFLLIAGAALTVIAIAIGTIRNIMRSSRKR